MTVYWNWEEILSWQSARLFLQWPAGKFFPSLWFRARGEHSLAGDEDGGVPFRARGQTLWYRYSRYICTFWEKSIVWLSESSKMMPIRGGTGSITLLYSFFTKRTGKGGREGGPACRLWIEWSVWWRGSPGSGPAGRSCPGAAAGPPTLPRHTARCHPHQPTAQQESFNVKVSDKLLQKYFVPSQTVLWIRIRINVISWTRIRNKVIRWIRIRNKVISLIRIRVKTKCMENDPIWVLFWKLGSGSGPVSNWKVESGSASKWPTGSGLG